MAADRAGTSGSLLMVLVFWLRSVENFRLFLPVNWSRKRAGSEYARPFPQLKPKALIRNEVARRHRFIPLQTPEAFRNAGSRGCFWFARSLRWFSQAVHCASIASLKVSRPFNIGAISRG